MKIQISQFLLCFVIAHLLAKPIEAADFSQAQQTYVPPSLIQRGLNALGTNNLGFPSLDSSSANSGGGMDLTSIFSAISPSSNQVINGGNASAPSTWGTLQGLAGNYKNIPGLSTFVGKIQSKVSSLTQSGNLGAAENLARAGLKYFPNNSILKGQFASITATEAQALLQAHNYDAAGKKARETLVADPNNKVSKTVVGKVLKAQGLDPKLAESHVTAGDGLTADGRTLEASVEYKLANDIKPTAAAHVGLGNIAVGKGDLTQASGHFEHALTLDPNNALAYRQRGALHYLMQDPVSANSDFSKAIALNPNDPAAGGALIGLWKQQVAISPNSANSHLGLARAYLQTHNLEAARNEYKTVVSIDPNHPSLPAARASFKAALAKQEADKSVQAAKTLESQGALNEAHQKLVEAVGYTPSDPQILLYHGQISEKLGLSSDAHAAYMSALKTDPKNVEAAAGLKRLGYNNSVPAIATPGVLSPTTNIQPSANLPPLAPSHIFNAPNAIIPTPSPPAYTSAPIPMVTPPMFASPAPTSVPSLAPAITLPPALNTNPLPQENLQDIPLKSPLPPKTQSQLPPGNAYYNSVDNVYIGDPAEVTMLGNFGSCVRALVMAQRQLLQNQQSNNKFTNNTNFANPSFANPDSNYSDFGNSDFSNVNSNNANSGNLSTMPNNWF